MDQSECHEETALQALARLGCPECLLKIGDSEMDRFVHQLGGFLPCELTEIVGDTAAGKSQLCLSLVASFLCDQSKLGYNVAIMDSNGSFRSSRLLQILKEKWNISAGLAQALLTRVFVRRAWNSAQLSSSLQELLATVDDCRIDLVIVDNIGSALSDTVNNDYLTTGLNVQLATLKSLKQIASRGCWVLVVNHLVYWRSAPTPALGYRWINEISNRVLITTDEHLPDVHWMQMFPNRKINEARIAIELAPSGVRSHSEATQSGIPPHSQVMDSFLIDVEPRTE